MKNIKPVILQALESNSALISLLGGKSIYQMVAMDPNEFPRITFFELNNYDQNYIDDQANTSKITIQIDIWSKGSTTKIAQEVDKTMKLLNFRRYAAHDLYENDTKIFHKAMRYETLVELQEGE